MWRRFGPRAVLAARQIPTFESRHLRWTATAALAALWHSSAEAKEEPLSHEEALRLLRKELAKVRSRHEERLGAKDKRRLLVTPASEETNGLPKVSFELPKSTAMSMRALHALLAQLGPGASLSPGQPAGDKSTVAFHLQTPGTESEIVVADRGAVWLTYEGELTASVVEAVADAYEMSLEGLAEEDRTKREPSRVFGFRLSPDGFNLEVPNQSRPEKGADTASASPIQRLVDLGVEVYDADGQVHGGKQNNDGGAKMIDWESMAGYESVKSELKDTVVLALQNPEAYDEIAKRTRARFESNRPKAVLFEGPPGTGKTLCARILASQAEKPFILLRTERIVSKWYGESEKRFGTILDACEEIDGGAVLFIDEVDALAQQRGGGDGGGGMHEATRRLLGVLLQRLEGFTGKSKCTLIAATNRRQDLDPALLSRFDLILNFDMPDFDTRVAVLQRYAQQLSPAELAQVAQVTSGMSCRDLKEICEHTERRFASRVLKGVELRRKVPSIGEYLQTAKDRLSRSYEGGAQGAI